MLVNSPTTQPPVHPSNDSISMRSISIRREYTLFLRAQALNMKFHDVASL